MATTNVFAISPALQESIEPVLLAIAVVGYSDNAIKQVAGMSRDQLLRMLTRHLRRVVQARVQDELFLTWEDIEDLADGLPPDLRARLREIERSLLKPCEKCGRIAIEPMSTKGGSPQRFCSNACRQAEYRARRKAKVV